MKKQRKQKKQQREEPGKSLLGKAGRAAAGLTAAAAAAYGVYLVGATRSRRQPVTELAASLDLRLSYVPWRDQHYAYYSRHGEGTPVVFLHSINAAASAHEMRPLVRRFQRQTRRPLFALEWLGFGHSDRPDVSYTPELLETQLEQFLERVVRRRGPVDVVALSLGASYAAEVARRRPALVRSLVAIEPTGLGPEASPIAEGWAKLLFAFPGVQRAFYDRLTAPDALRRFAAENLFSPQTRVPEDFVRFGAETARMEGASRPLDDFLEGRLFPENSEVAFREMPQPLLVLYGTVADRRLESYEKLPDLEALPRVSSVAYNTGALPHWEEPDQVAIEILRFHESSGRSSGDPLFPLPMSEAV